MLLRGVVISFCRCLLGARLVVANPADDVPRGGLRAVGGFAVSGLVVEEEVGLEFAQEGALVQTAQEEGLVHLHFPVHQRADGAFMRRGAAGRHQGGTDAHMRGRGLAQAVERFQQRLEGAGGQRGGGAACLVVLEGRQPLAGIDLLGFVGEQYGVAVEGDAHFVGVGFCPLGRLRVDACGREAGFQRGPNVVGVGRQEEVGAQRLQVRIGGPAAREDAAFQRHAMMVGRAEGAHAAGGVVAREQDHVHAPLGLVVEGQQLLHQRHGHAALGGQVQQLQLARHVGAVVTGLEQAVLFLEVEEGTGGNGDDQLDGRRGHGIRGPYGCAWQGRSLQHACVRGHGQPEVDFFMKRTIKLPKLLPKDLSVRMKSSMWTAMLLLLISGLFALTFVPDVQIVSVDDEWYKARVTSITVSDRKAGIVETEFDASGVSSLTRRKVVVRLPGDTASRVGLNKFENYYLILGNGRVSGSGGTKGSEKYVVRVMGPDGSVLLLKPELFSYIDVINEKVRIIIGVFWVGALFYLFVSLSAWLKLRRQRRLSSPASS